MKSHIFPYTIIALLLVIVMVACSPAGKGSDMKFVGGMYPDDDYSDDAVVDDDDSATDDDDDNDDDTVTDDDDDDDDDNDDDDDVLLGMVVILAGSFQMGAEPEDAGFFADETPRHEVQMAKYAIDKYEVTNAAYVNYLNEHNPGNDCNGAPCIEDSAESDFNGIYSDGGTWAVSSDYASHPVALVSWEGAKAYCNAKGKTLPTEAQWEKAAKGADENYIFPWGDTWIANASNHSASGDPYEGGAIPETTPFGYFDGDTHGDYETTDGASPYGVYDMAGNVWEWVSDFYKNNYYSTMPDGGWVDPAGPGTGTQRVARGGAYNGGENGERTSNRLATSPDDYYESVGFRCAKDLD